MKQTRGYLLLICIVSAMADYCSAMIGLLSEELKSSMNLSLVLKTLRLYVAGL